MGREVVLYDCDDFTRDFYRSFLDLEQLGTKIEHPPLTHAAWSGLSHAEHGRFRSI